eukprot:scaffold109935_cov32-Tisochrysis_lutea.AAC.4
MEAGGSDGEARVALRDESARVELCESNERPASDDRTEAAAEYLLWGLVAAAPVAMLIAWAAAAR